MSEMDNNGHRKAEGRSRLLVASLAINLFLVGIVVGGLVTGGHLLHRPDPGDPHLRSIHGLANPRRVIRAADEGHRRELFQMVRKDFGGMRPLFEELRTTRREMFEVIATDPFDEQRATEILDHLTAIEAKAQSEGNVTVIKMLSQLSREERQRFLEQSRRRPSERFRHHAPPPPDGPEGEGPPPAP